MTTVRHNLDCLVDHASGRPCAHGDAVDDYLGQQADPAMLERAREDYAAEQDAGTTWARPGYVPAVPYSAPLTCADRLILGAVGVVTFTAGALAVRAGLRKWWTA